MNSSDILESIYTYLGYKGVEPEERTNRLISECLDELEKIQQFRYLYKIIDNIPAFLQKEPYKTFLDGCTSVILCVTTLGSEVDKRIKYLGRTDIRKSVIFDACASAYLEFLADGKEKTFGEDITYRFCPGYGGSSIADIKYIFEILKPEKTGVTLLESNLMLPQKSMAGIIGIGKNMQKSCDNCINFSACMYRKEGATCFGSVKK